MPLLSTIFLHKKPTARFNFKEFLAIQFSIWSSKIKIHNSFENQLAQNSIKKGSHVRFRPFYFIKSVPYEVNCPPLYHSITRKMALVTRPFYIFTAPTSLIQTVERELSTDWTIPLVFSYQSIFIKNPTSVYNYTAYLEPMTYLSWAMVAVFLLLMPIPLYYVARYSKDSNRFPIGQAFGSVYVNLLLLGSPNDPNKVHKLRGQKYPKCIWKSSWKIAEK